MDIILLQDVAKLGIKGSVANVNPGYGQFLIKVGKAKLATVKAKALAQKAQQEKANAEEKYNTEVQLAVENFTNQKLIIKAKANDKDHLFEGINAQHISEALSDKLGVNVTANMIEMDNPIKEIGEYVIGVITSSWEGSVTVGVVKED